MWAVTQQKRDLKHENIKAYLKRMRERKAFQNTVLKYKPKD